MNHEIFVSKEAASILGRSSMLVEQQAAEIANEICLNKGYVKGLSCMVVARDSAESKGGRSAWFVINQLLDTQLSVNSTHDLNKNTRSLNRDTHCILSTRGNGPNRYAGFKRLLSDTRNNKLKARIK